MKVCIEPRAECPAQLPTSMTPMPSLGRSAPAGSRRIQTTEQKHAAGEDDCQQRSQVEARLPQHGEVTPEAHCRTSLSVTPLNNARQRGARPLVAAGFVCTAALTGCSSVQSALAPHGGQAHVLARLFWVFTAVLALVWAVTIIVLLLAMQRGRRRGEEAPASRPPPGRPMWATFFASLAAGTAILVGLSVVSFGGQAAIYARRTPAVRISITGHQWWWQVRYEEPDPARSFETANEIRIPVGAPVEVKLATADVIHSFWIPSLAGKLDLIPGRDNVLDIEAEKPGIYRGQCAEFCGRQHAHMAMFVVALPPDEFEKWRAGQIAGTNPVSDAGNDATGIGTAAPR
jgi:cytochrome c oxidase subunit II